MESTSCYLCKQNNFSLLFDKGRNNKKVNNFICENCGFVMILPRPKPEFLDDQYKDSAFSKEARGSYAPDSKKLHQTDQLADFRYRLLHQYDHAWTQSYAAAKPKRFLEVGCGTGSFLRLMKASGWQVEGIEPDGQYTASVKEDFELEITDAYLEDFETTALYDFVASFHVIEHVPDPNTFIEKCHKLLKRGGRLMIECPAIDKIYGDKVDFFFWDVHINTFSKETLTALLLKHNFKILETNWHDNFINILCEKSDEQGDFKAHFDSPKRIKKLVADYTPAKKSLVDKAGYGISLLREEPTETFGKASRRIKEVIGQRSKLSLLDQKKGGKTLTHIANFTTNNAGDTYLPVILRDLFNLSINADWERRHAHTTVDSKAVKRMNQTKGVIIGGGGLFLKDTNPNNLSGWQWSCSMDDLQKLQVPIALFAVGYNRFRGQADFAPIFTEHVRLLTEKATIIGLRNYGSIDGVKQYLPAALHEKLVFQPCMTTLSSYIYGAKALRENDTPPFVAVNCAFDRSKLRFGQQIGRSLSNLASGLKQVGKHVPIKYYAHSPADEVFLPFLDSFGVHYELVKLYDKSPRTVLDAYRAPLLAIGMRGHAQLIPFGSQRPIISIISHNKLRYFLDDIGAPEWGIDINDEHLADQLVEKVVYMLKNMKMLEKSVQEKQQVLWEKTQENVSTIKAAFNI